jgi:hydrogenase small subunit
VIFILAATRETPIIALRLTVLRTLVNPWRGRDRTVGSLELVCQSTVPDKVTMGSRTVAFTDPTGSTTVASSRVEGPDRWRRQQATRADGEPALTTATALGARISGAPPSAISAKSARTTVALRSCVMLSQGARLAVCARNRHVGLANCARDISVPIDTPVWRDGTLGDNLQRAGVSRRDFMGFCVKMAAVFAVAVPVVGLPAGTADAAPTAQDIADKLLAVKKPNVVWLQLQECTGCLESTLRSGATTVEDIILNLLSVNYVELLMAPAGGAATAALDATNREPHILVVNGSVPLGAGGAYTVIGGKSAKQVLEESAENATSILAVGACAVWGSVQASRPNPTGAVGIDQVITDKPVLNVAGCPPIGEVITAAITYLLTFGKSPSVDDEGRPLFAYGERIHDACPRRAHFDAGEYVETFDDAGANQGWCLYEVGCKGPETFSPCPVTKWNLGTSFPIDSGHPCIGCTERDFFDRFTPFYQVLPDIHVPGIGVESTANKVGGALLGVTAAGVAIHAVATATSRGLRRRGLRADDPLPAFGDPERVFLPMPTMPAPAASEPTPGSVAPPPVPEVSTADDAPTREEGET